MVVLAHRVSSRAFLVGCWLWFSAALLLGGTPVAVAQEEAPPAEREPAWLGVWSADAVDGGAQILAVVSGGPAAKGGLRGGDVVLEIAGRTLAGEADLGRALRGFSPGDSVPLRVLRDGEPIELTVLLTRRDEHPRLRGLSVPEVGPVPAAPLPPSPSVWTVIPGGRDRVGFGVADIGPDLRSHYGAPSDVGVLVTSVDDGTAAAKAGLAVGDVLVQIAQRPIRSEREVRSNLERWNVTRPLSLQVVRAGRSEEIVLPASVESERRAPEAELVERRLQAEIDRLERRLAELRRQLADLHSGD